ncbi:serine incorporator 1-like protein, partial [Plakobranchus ocellatus]
AACCCGSAACSLCCAACPSCKNSTASRIGYALMLLVGSIVALFMLIPGIRHKLDEIPGLCRGIIDNDYVDTKTQAFNKEQCDSVVGFLAVYRVCFAMAMFFILFAIIMIKVQSSKDPRSKIQNGCFKFSSSHPKFQDWHHSAPVKHTELILFYMGQNQNWRPPFVTYGKKFNHN